MVANFSTTINNIFLKNKGVPVYSFHYMEMPKEKKQYNLSKVIGNVNLSEGRYIVKSEAERVVSHFLTMKLP